MTRSGALARRGAITAQAADAGEMKKTGGQDKLVILSDTDDSFLAGSVPRTGAGFHAVFTAEQSRFCKPRYGAFEFMLDQLDATPDDFPHVSSHTRCDLMPADDLGLKNKVLLDRGAAPHSPAYHYYVTIKSLDEVSTTLGICLVRHPGDRPAASPLRGRPRATT
jgi:2-haloacid dehalogenase